MKCPKCKAELSDERATFCTYCGAMFDAQVQSEPSAADIPAHSESVSKQESSQKTAERQNRVNLDKTKDPENRNRKDAPGKTPAGTVGEASEPASSETGTDILNVLNRTGKAITVTLLFFFGLTVPVVNLLIIIAIIFLSFRVPRLFSDMKQVFDRRCETEHAEFVKDTGNKFKIIRMFIFYSIIILVLFALEFAFEINSPVFSLLMGVFLLPYIPLALYPFYLMAVCFFRLFTLRKALTQLASSENLITPEDNTVLTVIGTIILALTFMIQAASILVSVALFTLSSPDPEAVEEYRKVSDFAMEVRQQVELCIKDVGESGMNRFCNLGYSADPEIGQKGWDLSYFRKNDAVGQIFISKGVIDIRAVEEKGLGGASYVMEPEIRGNRINWILSDRSTCLERLLCKKEEEK